jgi:hypothetical protein
MLHNSAGEFYLTVELHREWLAFVVNPLVDDLNPAGLARLSYHLCRLNGDTVMARFFIDEELDVGVCVELPRDCVQETGFRRAVEEINGCLRSEYNELRLLAKDPKALSKYLHDSSFR